MEELFDEIVDSKKVFAVPNVVPTVVKANIARNDGNVNLLYLGFIYQAKGIFDLAEVINLSKERYRGKVKLYVGGSGVEEERLADFIKSNNLGDLIEMCGWVSGEDKNQLLSQCDAYILPSYIEGLPVSIIEAMTYGLPIISTKVGGIPEIVKDGKNGILFNSGDKQALSNSIDLLVNDNKHRKLMGMESLKMSKEYLPDNIVYCLNEMYKSLIE